MNQETYTARVRSKLEAALVNAQKPRAKTNHDLITDDVLQKAIDVFAAGIGQQWTWQFALEKALIAASEELICERFCSCEYHGCERKTIGLEGTLCTPCEVGAHEDGDYPPEEAYP